MIVLVLLFIGSARSLEIINSKLAASMLREIEVNCFFENDILKLLAPGLYYNKHFQFDQMYSHLMMMTTAKIHLSLQPTAHLHYVSSLAAII